MYGVFLNIILTDMNVALLTCYDTSMCEQEIIVDDVDCCRLDRHEIQLLSDTTLK